MQNFKKKRIGVIVQARMGSKRLPGKVMMPILGEPMIGILLSRIKKTDRVDAIIVATSEKSIDDVIEDYVNSVDGVTIFRGHEEDVLTRILEAAVENSLSHILRVTGDNPFYDWDTANQLVNMMDEGHDYVANNINRTFPYGIDLELITYEALKLAASNSASEYDHEHVTPYIRRHKELFKLGGLENAINLSDQRLTVDTREDYLHVIKIFESFGTFVTFRDIF
jgi:spore coat polysaccharide biosynthesis protein SpsF (cytidylyltransferase family)